MADSSRIFTPPVNALPAENDFSTIIRVPLGMMPWGARESTKGRAWNQRGQSNDADGTGNVKNLPNGR